MTTEAMLCRRIKTIRGWMGLTQEDLRLQLGFESKMSYWRLENGHTEMTIRVLTQCCRIFGLTPSEMLDFSLSEQQLMIKVLEHMQLRHPLHIAAAAEKTVATSTAVGIRA